MSNTEINIGQRVKNQRLSKGMTIKVLSEITGLSVGHISEIENGIKSNLQQKTILKLSHGLKMSVTELLGVDEE